MNEESSTARASDETPEKLTRAHGTHREERVHPRLWTRARQAFFALPRGLHVVMLVIFMILGFALATQVRAQRSDPLEGLSEQDLVTVLDELSTQEQNLRSAASEADAREQATRKAQTQAQIAAGTVAVHGPGVTVGVTDPSANLTPTQFVQTLGELRNAGAEAIELNGVRLSTRSAFTGQAGSIVVDGTPISSPYTWKVIGEGQTIATALDIQAGSAAQMRAKGATVTITPVNDLSISSIATPKPPQFATYG